MDREMEVLKKYVPKNLDECLQILDQMMLDKNELLNVTEDEFIGMSHHGLGQRLRNEWGLWEKKNKLTSYFNQLGVNEADDMSGMILRSFHRKMNGKHIDVLGQVKKCQEYWKNVQKNGDPTFMIFRSDTVA